ncbi:hypothetical protein DXG03_008068, partial [Asterophora parasitica]
MVKRMKQKISYEITTEDPPDGVARIIVGKKVVKEAWELELERREKARRVRHADFDDDCDTRPKTNVGTANRLPEAESNASGPPAAQKPREVIKEAWEIEAEQ